jgi:outer membrane protein assembly factor BamB
MYQAPQSYTYYEERKRRRRLRPFVLLLLPFAVVGFMLFGVSYFVSPEPDIEVKPGIGYASVDGRDVVLAPYERHGTRGMFQLIFRDMFQVRLAAADAKTGEVLWDTQVSDALIWDASVLAAGERYAYLATGSGLIVVDLRDGAIVAQGDGITGLGGAFVAAPQAYGYDAANRRVMAMSASGGILAIALDTVTAEPTDAGAWATTLSATRPSLSLASATAPKATNADERYELRDAPVGSVLIRITPDGAESQIGTTVFHRASIVVDGTAAAGAGKGHLLVEHSRSVNDTDTVLTAVSLATGTVTGSLPVESGADRAVTLPDGTTVVAAGDVLAALGADGHVIPLPVGATDYLGNPS